MEPESQAMPDPEVAEREEEEPEPQRPYSRAGATAEAHDDETKEFGTKVHLRSE